jgi:predicted chitinase
MSSKVNADYLLSAAAAAGIKDPKEQANFMGQMQVECGGFGHMSEGLNYSGERLLEVFPGRNGLHTIAQANAITAGGPEAVANAVYGGAWGKKHLGNTEPGDGWTFHGRGYVQLTGRDAYERIGKEIGQDLVHHPELAADREIAAKIAIQYWQDRVVPHHHQTDVMGACRDINGGENGLKDRKAAAAAWDEKLTHGYIPGGPASASPEHHHTPARHASTSPAAAPRIDHVGNPDHVLYARVLAGVHEAEAERHITPGLHSERLAAALVVAAKSEGMKNIDRVVLSDNGERAFVTQRGTIPLVNDKLAFVETKEAIHTTLTQSTTALTQVNHQQQLAQAKAAVAPPIESPQPAPSQGHAR